MYFYERCVLNYRLDG